MPIACVNGIRLHYHLKGNKGIPILFVPPPLLTEESFQYQKIQLADRFRVLTYDVRGHGHSEPSREPLTYPLLVEDIRQLLDLLQLPQVYICGYSTGGQLALAAMLTYPDRFLGGIIVSGMPGVSDWYLRMRITLAEWFTRLRLKRALTSLISLGNADSLRTFRNLYGSARLGDVRNLGQYYRISKKTSYVSRLGEITKPMLLIYGSKDKGFYRYADVLHRRLPNSTLCMLQNQKHHIPMKAARDMNELIAQFITSPARFAETGRTTARAGQIPLFPIPEGAAPPPETSPEETRQ
jgi:pimeloyl-ACP methyl ester carboxylesterase